MYQLGTGVLQHSPQGVKDAESAQRHAAQVGRGPDMKPELRRRGRVTPVGIKLYQWQQVSVAQRQTTNGFEFEFNCYCIIS